ncbi:Conidiophore development protein hymA [Penicillium digitatum PHI26]|uniref:Conidiophore development protein hymA n=2 Tax=Penicillium digitatum TaxID=36651 RepID=K9F9V6_PEND2|nr:Conidiophore development protein hymA [Penicillium digitatum Pd1]EKV05899.1 Conidiophore development protein hymA [Penicillium digitatum PHI26]EKV17957.1 Conidiophore development protein hymA [Penicillium digitatum Pd1]
MAFFFNRGRSRQPADIVRTTKELLLRIHDSQNVPKVRLKATRMWRTIRLMKTLG